MRFCVNTSKLKFKLLYGIVIPRVSQNGERNIKQCQLCYLAKANSLCNQRESESFGDFYSLVFNLLILCYSSRLRPGVPPRAGMGTAAGLRSGKSPNPDRYIHLQLRLFIFFGFRVSGFGFSDFSLRPHSSRLILFPLQSGRFGSRYRPGCCPGPLSR